MANTYTQLYIHMVFSTKYRSPILLKEDWGAMHQYLGGILTELKCIPITIGGVENHVHLLFRVDKMKSIVEVARVVKANSSKWIKSQRPRYADFIWQDGYSAFTVSKSLLRTVSKYIAHQEEHHQNCSFEQEYRQLLVLHDIEFSDEYLFD